MPASAGARFAGRSFVTPADSRPVGVAATSRPAVNFIAPAKSRRSQLTSDCFTVNALFHFGRARVAPEKPERLPACAPFSRRSIGDTLMNSWTCSVPGCTGNRYTRHLCGKHWARIRKYGDIDYVTPTDSRKQTVNNVRNNISAAYVVNAETGCWIWIRGKDSEGYGKLTARRASGKVGGVLAHKYIYENIHGPVSEGLELDHLCRNPSCVNPAHLEPVTHAENVRRGKGNGFKDQTHCKNGHAFTPDNTEIRPGGGRNCRMCRKISSRNLYRIKAGIPLDAPRQKTGRKT